MQSLETQPIEVYVAAIRILLAVGATIDLAEQFLRRGDYAPDGIFSGRIFATAFDGVRNPPLVLLRSFVCSSRGLTAIMVARGCGIALTAAVWLTGMAAVLGATMMLVSAILFSYRCPYGRDGADQMEVIVAAGLTVTLMFGGGRGAALGLWFIAAQSILSYVTSGVAKAVSPLWRNGEAFYRIFNTHAYGSMGLAHVATRYRPLGLSMCWLTISLECAFVVALWLPPGALAVLLASAGLFHVINAAVMGLNKFLWSWTATYPALLFSAGRVATNQWHM